MSYTTIENENAPSLVVLDTTRELIVVSGSIGPKGDPGGTTLGTKPITITSLQGGDVLQYNALQDAWINVPQSSITDGGTF